MGPSPIMLVVLATFVDLLAALTAAALPERMNQKADRVIPIIKRSGLVNSDKTVNVNALNSHKASAKAVLCGLNNFEKNTGSPHPAALMGTQRRDTCAVSLIPDNIQLWYGPISVGTPPITYTGMFLPSSNDGPAELYFNDLFLPGPECTSSSCSSHTKYYPESSWTSEDLHETFSLLYGGGSTVSGEQYSDTVAVAGLTATHQTLGAASQYSTSPAKDSFPADGLMGMAFRQTSQFFSFKLASSGSELYLGGANSALYTWHALDHRSLYVIVQGYWEVDMDGIKGNGQTILSNIDCIIDTGTTPVVGNPSQVTSLYDKLGGTDASSMVGQGYYTFPCDSFPDIGFTFGGTTFPISAATLNLGQVSSDSIDCVSGIIGQDTGASFWIIGDVFLQNVYTKFDVGNTRVGFAKLA